MSNGLKWAGGIIIVLAIMMPVIQFSWAFEHKEDIDVPEEFQIVVNYPHDGDKVPVGMDAEGKIICSQKRIGLLIVPVVKPFMHPDYWIQGIDELNFNKVKQHYEAGWITHCWIGEESTRRQRFNVYFFVLTDKQSDHLYGMAKEGSTAISPANFRNRFFDNPQAYLFKYGPIVVKR